MRLRMRMASDNIDYNSLKHHIKVHTTKDQATAIAIPGRRDTALGKFEDELYSELCCQHDRVHLFVTSKADEIARRLRMTSTVPNIAGVTQSTNVMLHCRTPLEPNTSFDPAMRNVRSGAHVHEAPPALCQVRAGAAPMR